MQKKTIDITENPREAMDFQVLYKGKRVMTYKIELPHDDDGFIELGDEKK